MSTAAERVEAWDRARRNAAEFHREEFAARLRAGDDRLESLRITGYQCGFYRDWTHRKAIIEALELTDPAEITTFDAGHDDWTAERAEYVNKYGYA